MEPTIPISQKSETAVVVSPAATSANKIWLLLPLILLFGVWLRFADLGQASLSHDEAWRANWTHHGTVGQARRFPLLQWVMLRTVQSTFGRSEFVLRAPNALAGALAILVVCAFAVQYDRPQAGLIAAALMACHPVLIHHARNNKVFGLEVLLCPLLLWFGYEAYARMSRASVWRFALTGVVGLGLTFSSAFVIAGWSPILIWQWARGRQELNGLSRHVVAAGFLLTVCGVAWVVWLIGCPFRGMMTEYFATQEVSWPASYHPIELAKWMAVSGAGIAKFVLAVNAEWPPISWCVATAQVVAVTAALGLLWKRHRPLCVVFALVLLFMFAAGAAKFWPVGRIRTMTFLVPFVMIIVAMGLGEIIQRWRWSPPTIVIMLLAVATPGWQAVSGAMTRPESREHVRPVFEYIQKHAEPSDAIFAYYGASDAVEYYGNIAAAVRDYSTPESTFTGTMNWFRLKLPIFVQPHSDRGDLQKFMIRFDDWITQHRRVWLIFAHPWQTEVDQWAAEIKKTYKQIDLVTTRDCSAHLINILD